MNAVEHENQKQESAMKQFLANNSWVLLGSAVGAALGLIAYTQYWL